LSDRGNAFGYSIQRSLQAFYASVTGAADSRMSTQLGVDVVNLCHDIANQVRSDVPPPEAACSAKPLVVANHRRSESDGFHTGLNGTATASCSTACALADREYAATTLVLGGTGFIGKELVRQLVERNYRVKVLSRASATPGDLFEHPAVEMVRGSMANPAVLAGALEGVDHVFHLARAHVKRWADWQQLDVQGTKTVAEACLRAGVKRLIYTGTIDSYYAGRGAGTIREETGLDRHIRRRNYYARAKCEAESLLLDLHRRHRLPVVIFRPGIVLGPGGSPFHWGVGMWSGNTVCQLWGEGKHPLPIVLVSDVAAAMIAAIDEPGIEGESFNLVGEPSLSAREYLDELGRTLNVRLDVIPKPIWQFYLADMLKWCVKCAVRHPDRKLPSYRDWESRTQRARFDCTKAQQRLKWRPTTDRARIVREGIVEPAAEFAQ
ncbi:MAG TPA: NAD-dependent epimerase/dehydratase family protein, partial [Pirellulales bacterium]|nr:NAD-dependent epimerase/dehydratase family protein [Pirellulales bacterium]